MNKILRNLLSLALLAVASGAWAAGDPANDQYITRWGTGEPPFNAVSITEKPDLEIDGLYYNIVDGGVELTRYDIWDNGYSASTFVVPASVSIEGKAVPVVRIGNGAFHKNKNLTEITIPEGVKSIGYGAFFYTENLKKVNLPSTLESIEGMAFAYSTVSEINLAKGVKSIGKDAFGGCLKLTSVTLGKNIEEIGKNAIGSVGWTVEAPHTFVQYIWTTHIADLYCLSTVPATVDETLFKRVQYGDPMDKTYIKSMYEVTKLHVPAESVELYKQTAPWNQFKTILGDGESSVTETVVKAEGIRLVGGRIVGEGVMDVYDLGGRQVARGTTDQLPELPAGFYIVRNASTAAKILVP